MPTGVAPHKRIDPEPGPEVRLELARAAAADAEPAEGGGRWLAVSALEVEREGPSFAYRTLELLADEKPGSELTFVMGADAAVRPGGLAPTPSASPSWRDRGRQAERAGADDAVDAVRRLGGRAALAIEMLSRDLLPAGSRAHCCRALHPLARARPRGGSRSLQSASSTRLAEEGGERSQPAMTPEELAIRIAEVADSKLQATSSRRGRDIVGDTDVLVICTARTAVGAKDRRRGAGAPQARGRPAAEPYRGAPSRRVDPARRLDDPVACSRDARSCTVFEQLCGRCRGSLRPARGHGRGIASRPGRCPPPPCPSL